MKASACTRRSIFDGRNLFNPETMREIGFTYSRRRPPAAKTGRRELLSAAKRFGRSGRRLRIPGIRSCRED